MITNLRLRLLEEGGPQYMIAARAGMHPTRLSEYALGTRSIPMHHGMALCEVLHCQLEDIVGYAYDDDEAVV